MATKPKQERKLPKAVGVFGHAFEVELVPSLGDHGRFEPDDGVIFINKDISADEQWSTLFHEMLHAALFLGGLSEVLGGQLEEGVVRCIENSMWSSLEFKEW